MAVCSKLISRVAGAVVAAQGVDAALLTVTVIRPRAFVNLCITNKTQGQKVTKEAKQSIYNSGVSPLKKLAANPALFTEPSDTNFIHSWLELLLISSGFS